MYRCKQSVPWLNKTTTFSIRKSLSPANFKRHKKPFYSPHLPYFLKVQLRKCMEPIGNLANVEELDLKPGQQAGKKSQELWCLYYNIRWFQWGKTQTGNVIYTKTRCLTGCDVNSGRSSYLMMMHWGHTPHILETHMYNSHLQTEAIRSHHFQAL